MARKPRPWFRAGRGWYAQVAGKQIRIAGASATLKEAERKLQILMSTSAPSPEKITIGQLIARFGAWSAQHRRKRTTEWYAWHFAQWLASGEIKRSMPAHSIKGYHVDRWAQSGDVSGSSRHARVAVAQRLFRWAVKYGYLSSSPIAMVERPKRSKSRKLHLTDKQRQQLLQACPNQTARQMVETLMRTGCRPQELRTVEARHFKPEIGQWRFSDDESKGNIARTVYLPPETVDLCKMLARLFPTGPLFRDSRGRPWTPNGIRMVFDRLKELVDIPGLCAYGMRHDFATRLLASGVSPEIVRILMGHTSLAMITAHYSHVDQRHDVLSEAVSRHIGGISVDEGAA